MTLSARLLAQMMEDQAAVIGFVSLPEAKAKATEQGAVVAQAKARLDEASAEYVRIRALLDANESDEAVIAQYEVAVKDYIDASRYFATQHDDLEAANRKVTFWKEYYYDLESQVSQAHPHDE